jgi:23S rRNA (guanosine2251-2'-O)-methyltransferase
VSSRKQIRGVGSIAAALDRGAAVQRIVVADATIDSDTAAIVQRADDAGIAVQRVSARHFRRLLATREDCRAIGFVGPALDADVRTVIARDGVTWQFIDVAYPGNAGVALRTAEVSGSTGAFVSGDFDREARRNALRASMRADRFMPVFFAAAEPVLLEARSQGRRIIAIEDCGDRSPWEVDLLGRVHLVVGGESDGIPPALLETVDEVVRLPMTGFLPSYNLQAAVAAVAYERLRQASMVDE